MSRLRAILRWFRLLAPAVTIAVLIVGVLVIPGWIPLLPRPVQRRLTEGVLLSILVVYGTVVLVAVAGTPLAAWRLSRAIRRREPWRLMGRALLVGVSCVLSLAILELGSAAISRWIHRLPRLPTTFEPTPAGEWRVVVLGGSSALGEPYRPALSVGQIVAWQLQEAMPGRRFVCEILAWLGDSLEMQYRKLAKLKGRPDAIVIYSGHNEFAARFEEERDPFFDEEPLGWLAEPVYRATLSSPFCRLVYDVVSKNRLDRPPPLTGRHQLIDPPQCTPAETDEILAEFGRRLESIVAYCDQIGALAILIVPPANEAGFEPSRSTVPRTVSAAERRRLTDDYDASRRSELTDPGASARGYAEILERHPHFAEAHFRLARLLERGGNRREAAEHYLCALDDDGLPIRCPARFREVYAEVARRHPRAVLIDGRRELAAASATGLIGDEMIQDTHHPTLLGNLALAGAVLRELEARTVFDQKTAFALPLDPAACASHFQIDRGRWASVCERTSVHYERVARYRFDPDERLRKARAYAAAARLIQDGMAPEAVGLVGVGCNRLAPP